MPFLREDQYDIRVTVDGRPLGDSWATAEGGNLEADDSKTRPGGMGRQIALGGPAERDDVTVGVQFSDIVAGWHRWLESRVGVGRVKVGYTFLSAERTPVGPTHTIMGVLKGAAVPDYDADSSSAAMYQIQVSCHEQGA